MPLLNPAQCFKTPDRIIVDDRLGLPESWLTELTNQISAFLELSSEDKARLFEELTSHIGADSTYSHKNILRNSLQFIYLQFKKDEFKTDHKSAIATKLYEGVSACTPGFHDRTNDVLKSFTRPTTIDGFLLQIRNTIVERCARQSNQHNRLHLDSENTVDVHVHNRFFMIAQQEHLGIRALHEEDAYVGDLPTESIQASLRTAFAKHYQPIEIFYRLIEDIDSELRAFYGYQGRVNTGYSYTDFDKIHDFLKLFFEDAELELTDAFETNDAYQVFDLKWDFLLKKLWAKLSTEDYFILSEQETSIMDVFFNSNAEVLKRFMARSPELIYPFFHSDSLSILLEHLPINNRIVLLRTYIDSPEIYKINPLSAAMRQPKTLPSLLTAVQTLTLIEKITLFLTPDDTKQTTLMYAARYYHPMFDHLLPFLEHSNLYKDALLQVDQNENHALMIAATHQGKAVQSLLSSVSKLYFSTQSHIFKYANTDGDNTLMLAIRHQPQIVELLLQAFFRRTHLEETFVCLDDLASILRQKNQDGKNALALAGNQPATIHFLITALTKLESTIQVEILNQTNEAGVLTEISTYLVINHTTSLEALQQLDKVAQHSIFAALSYDKLRDDDSLGFKPLCQALPELDKDIQAVVLKKTDSLGNNLLLHSLHAYPEMFDNLLSILATISKEDQKAILDHSNAQGIKTWTPIVSCILKNSALLTIISKFDTEIQFYLVSIVLFAALAPSQEIDQGLFSKIAEFDQSLLFPLLTQTDQGGNNAIMLAAMRKSVAVKPLFKMILNLSPSAQLEILQQTNTDGYATKSIVSQHFAYDLNLLKTLQQPNVNQDIQVLLLKEILKNTLSNPMLDTCILLDELEQFDEAVRIALLKYRDEAGNDALELAGQYNPQALVSLFKVMGNLPQTAQHEILSPKKDFSPEFITQLSHNSDAIKSVRKLDKKLQVSLLYALLENALQNKASIEEPIYAMLQNFELDVLAQVLRQTDPLGDNALCRAVQGPTLVLEHLLKITSQFNRQTQIEIVQPYRILYPGARMLISKHLFKHPTLIDAIGQLDVQLISWVLNYCDEQGNNAFSHTLQSSPEHLNDYLQAIAKLSRHDQFQVLKNSKNPGVGLDSWELLIRQLKEHAEVIPTVQKLNPVVQEKLLSDLLHYILIHPSYCEKHLFAAIGEMDPNILKRVLNAPDENGNNPFSLAATHHQQAIDVLFNLIQQLDPLSQVEILLHQNHNAQCTLTQIASHHPQIIPHFLNNLTTLGHDAQIQIFLEPISEKKKTLNRIGQYLVQYPEYGENLHKLCSDVQVALLRHIVYFPQITVSNKSEQEICDVLDAFSEHAMQMLWNLTNKMGSNVLMHAIEHKPRMVLPLLHVAHAQNHRAPLLNHRNKKGEHVLMHAIRCQSEHVDDLLEIYLSELDLDHQAFNALMKGNKDGDHILMLAVKHRYPIDRLWNTLQSKLGEQKAQDLLQTMNDHGETALTIAAKYGDMHALFFLLILSPDAKAQFIKLKPSMQTNTRRNLELSLIDHVVSLRHNVAQLQKSASSNSLIQKELDEMGAICDGLEMNLCDYFLGYETSLENIRQHISNCRETKQVALQQHPSLTTILSGILKLATYLILLPYGAYKSYQNYQNNRSLFFPSDVEKTLNILEDKVNGIEAKPR